MLDQTLIEATTKLQIHLLFSTEMFIYLKSHTWSSEPSCRFDHCEVTHIYMAMSSRIPSTLTADFDESRGGRGREKVVFPDDDSLGGCTYASLYQLYAYIHYVSYHITLYAFQHLNATRVINQKKPPFHLSQKQRQRRLRPSPAPLIYKNSPKSESLPPSSPFHPIHDPGRRSRTRSRARRTLLNLQCLDDMRPRQLFRAQQSI